MNINTINIQQSLNVTEEIPHSVLGEIYNIFKNPNFNIRQSILRGKVSVDFSYRSWISELQNRWNSFQITARDYYQDWDDLAFRTGISKLWGDGYGVTPTQLNKSLQFGCSENECKNGPFWHNTEVEVVDLRPFKNIDKIDSEWNRFRFHGHNENWDFSQMKLKEIYVQANSGTLKPDFWGGNDNGEHLEKLWVEGNKNPAMPIMKWSIANGYNTGKTIIDHLYYRNNCTVDTGNQIERPNGTKFKYLSVLSYAGWQFRGWYPQNIILDSPIPIMVGEKLSFGNGLSNTTIYVPDHQLNDYTILYNQVGDDHSVRIFSWTTYNANFVKMREWYKYDGITLYDDPTAYMFADGNNY